MSSTNSNLNLLSQAFALACKLHAKQQRKSTGAYYVSHLLEVAGMVLAQLPAGQMAELIASAALLHDALEDVGEAQDIAPLIEQQCGRSVLELVYQLTEPGTEQGPAQKAPWRQRKEAYLDHVNTISAPALLIAIADKLHSLRELASDVKKVGIHAYAPFVRECDDLDSKREAVLWFQHAFADAASKRLQSQRLQRLLFQSAKVQAEDSSVSAILAACDRLLIEFEDILRSL